MVLFIQDDILSHCHVRAKGQFLVNGDDGGFYGFFGILECNGLAIDQQFAAAIGLVISA